MPNLKDIRRRADSVKKTQQITRAMRMVAAAKMRRAKDAIFAARPYAERMRRTLAEVAGSRPDAEHPLLIARDPVRRIEFVVVTSDRGLCGGFNSNVLKLAQAEVEGRGADETFVTPVGRKAMEHFRRHRDASITQTFESLGRIEYGHAARIARHLIGRYAAGEVDEVVLVYSEFVSAMTQVPRRVRLLPVSSQIDEDHAVSASGGLPYEIEPSASRLLEVLVPKALEVAVFRALLENQAGEHAARMAAMESATRNTEELIESLTLQYNRARQASITRELVEIVSGAEAL